MGFFKQFMRKESSKEKTDDIFIKPDKEYLASLIQLVNKKYEQFQYEEVDESSCDVFYMPTKKESYVGLQMGLSEQARLLKNNIKETKKIRSNCKNYIKILKQENQIIKIENIKNGKIDNIYLAYYENGYRYLFPYTHSGHRYPTYISVVHFEENKVVEEYMIQNNQILYKKYGKLEHNKVDYYYINYVPTGKCPILEEMRGYYLVDQLEYVEKEYYVWTQDR